MRTGDNQGKTLFIGIGNPDREDDGVAWHMLKTLAGRLGRTLSESDSVELENEPSPHLICELQLTPEMAEMISQYDRVCFVDAHTGAYPEEIRFEPVKAEYQSSPFTHHMTPQTCLVLAETLYGRAPQAMVLSVRGYEFGFKHGLSSRTARLADEALPRVKIWLSADQQAS